MKIVKIIAFCLVIVGIAARDIVAQSGRERPVSTREKPNQRPSESSPSPTPLPTAEPINSSVDDGGDVIRVDTQLVTVPVRVMDKKGNFVSGLTKENFKIFEDGIEKEIAFFANEQKPFTVALVLDMSYSSTFKIGEIQTAAIAFIGQLRPDDKVMVISFDQEVHMLCEATNDRKAIYRAIKSTKVATGTSLYEAVDLTINKRMRRIAGRKAIILFTDGVDTTSMRASRGNNLSDAMELDSIIYSIRYDTFADVQNMKNKAAIPLPPILNPTSKPGGNPFPFPVPTVGQPSNKGTTAEEYEAAREYLEKLADRTSGRMHLASSPENLAEIYAKIASELREFYSLGIYPDDVKVGKVRKIKVKVDQPNMAVRARDTYFVGKKDKSKRAK